MGLGRFLAGTALATGIGLAAYLTLTKQDPVTWGHHVKQQVQATATQLDEIRQAKNQVSQSTLRLTAAIEAAQPVLNDVQTEVDKFAFKAAPHLSAIQEVLDRQTGE